MFFLLLAASAFIVWYLFVFLLVIHEYGHLVVMAKLGVKANKMVVGNIRLFSFQWRGIEHEIGLIPLWAYVASKDYEKAPFVIRALIAAAGPASTLITGLAFYAIDYLHPNWVVKVAANASMLLFATNVIPLPPFDGWTVMEYVLSKKGISVSSSARTKLMCLGMAAICVITLSI